MQCRGPPVGGSGGGGGEGGRGWGCLSLVTEVWVGAGLVQGLGTFIIRCIIIAAADLLFCPSRSVKLGKLRSVLQLCAIFGKQLTVAPDQV